MFNLVQFIKKQAGDLVDDHKKEKTASSAQGLSGTIKLPKLDVKPAPVSGKSAVHDATSTPSVGRNQSAPKPQRTQKITKIPRPLSKIAYKRNTGVVDADGLPYTNTDDVELLSKLGYSVDKDYYLFLPMGESKEDLYSYVEKCAGVPSVPSQAIDKGEAFSGEYLKDMGYEVPKGYEVKGDLVCPIEKKAAADPAQTILITGHSGSGKSTLGKLLAEKLNLPLHRVDAHPEFKEYVIKDNEHWKDSLTPGTKDYEHYTDLVNRANKDTLKASDPASIVEGAQLGHLSPEELAKYKAHILVGGDVKQSIAQRIQRAIDKAAKKGIVYSPEEIALRKDKSKLVADYWQPGMDKFNKLPGVLKYNHTEHKPEALIDQLRVLMNKKAEAPQPNQIKNWKNTGINLDKPVLRPPVFNENFKHEGEITPRNYLGQIYGGQNKANQEIDKATSYAQQNNFPAPGRGAGWKPSDGSSNRLDVPVQIFTNPNGKSNQYNVSPPANYAASPEYNGRLIAPFGTDSNLKNIRFIPNINIGNTGTDRFGQQVPESANNTQKVLSNFIQKSQAHQNHYLPYVSQQYSTALNNFNSSINDPQSLESLKSNAPIPQTLQNSIKDLASFKNNVEPNIEDNVKNTLNHEMAHAYNRHQLGSNTDKQDTGYFSSNVERGTGISSLQQDLYKNQGSRAETPEAFNQRVSSFLNAPDLEQSMQLNGLNENSKRYLRYLKNSSNQQEILNNDALKAPGFVQNKQFTQPVKYAEAPHELKSSNIRAVGYSKENKKLEVAFHSGGNYTYNDVPKSLFDRIRKVKSPGKFFHKHIKRDNPYSYERMDKESEYKLHWSKDLHRDVTNNRHYPFSFLTGEAKELVDAVKNRDWANFKEEIGDSTYAAQMLAAQATGLNHPVYADLSKHYAREKVWKDMFKQKGSIYHPKHMEGGSNYAKPSKIIKAFASAGIKVDQREAERLANKHTGGKMEKEANVMMPRPGTVTNLEAYKEPLPSKMDMLGTILLGDAYMPTPRNQESMLEAKQRNRRNVDMGYLDTDTAKAIGEKISPFLGGNPVKARLDLERMQQDPNIMSQFKQANSILDKMQAKIYKQIEYAS